MTGRNEPLTLKVPAASVLERAQVTPSLDLNSTGQLDQAIDAAQPPERRTYQDLTLRIGLENSLERGGWRLDAGGNAVGVTRETQRLRFSDLAIEAPAVDLADYRIELSRGETRFRLGNVTAGSNRLLLEGFGSRGAGAAFQVGPAVGVDAAVVNGSNVVGWSNPLGMARSDHRIAVGTVNLELLPSRPGGVHLDVSGLDGSVLPVAGYTQGAATDAEESRGLGVRVAMSDARQRIRLAAGLARSRFVNPGDPFLFGDTSVVPVQPTTRTARYGELSLQLLQGLKLDPQTEVAAALTLRHERVDPLYRSVGGYLQSDVNNDGADVSASVGPLSLQGQWSAARDNLDEIPSILTTKTQTRGFTVGAPLGPILGALPTAWYLPALSYSWQRTRQFGEGLPDNGEFAESHVPDQWNTVQNGSAAFAGTTWSLTWQWNQSFQDNRQPGREDADFRSVVHGVSLALNGLGSFTPSLDVGTERQRNLETDQTQETDRIGASVQARLARSTTFSGSLSQAWGTDPAAEQRSRNTEIQMELSQGFDLYRRMDGNQARLFLRYSRTRAAFLPFAAAGLMPRVFWTFNAGGSVRLY
ncbi:MAG: hypothetical protein R2882_02285 [Gemmatimonadales bacterium]